MIGIKNILKNKMGQIKFSIVIPLRKINNFVRESIPYILKQTYKNFEIIIVSEADEKEKFDKTRIIRVGQISPAEKRNTGARKARGEIIAFIDDDAYPAPDWLENTLIYFEDKKIGGVAGPGLKPENAGFIETLSGLIYETSSEKTGIRYRKGKKQQVDDWPTCNLLIRKKDFFKIGGFSTKYWGGEDTEFCNMLIKKQKKKIIYDPGVVIYHHRRKSIGKHLKQSYFWGMWRGFFMKKYPKNSLKLTFMMPALFVLGLIVGLILSFFSVFFKIIYISVLIVYLFFLIFTGAKTNIKYFFPVIILTFLTQIVYGSGIIKGFFSKMPTRKTFNPAEKLKIK